MRWAVVTALTVVLVELHAREQVESQFTITKWVRALKVLLEVAVPLTPTVCSATGGMNGAMMSCWPLVV
jgi:hypothetical protein